MPIPFRLLRRAHLLTAPLVGAFVYSPTLRGDDVMLAAMQWLIFPAASAAGLAMWLGGRAARSTERRRDGGLHVGVR